jgi:hypothetical protein
MLAGAGVVLVVAVAACALVPSFRPAGSKRSAYRGAADAVDILPQGGMILQPMVVQ